MKINVGSMNAVKLKAVKEVIEDYHFLLNTEVNGIVVESGVSDQPKNLEEVVNGAINRARCAFQDCNYSIGIEDGLIQVPNTESGYMNVSFCAIYDGKESYLGASSLFEYPVEVIKLVLEEGLDINQAVYKSGLTKNPKVGSSVGAVGILTRYRVTRKEYIKQAIRMALIYLENSNNFKSTKST